MTTLVQRTKSQYTGTRTVPLHKTDEASETRLLLDQVIETRLEDLRRGTAATSLKASTAHVLGGKPRSHKSTPRISRISENLDRTPSARTKVLPWVQEVQDQDFEMPEGMWGPYDSQPPSRPPTMHQPPPVGTAGETAGMPVHPFAYAGNGTLPFSALGKENPEYARASKMYAEQGFLLNHAESDLLSRGAGVQHLNILGTETPGMTASRGSPGMGTFGRDPSMDPLVPQRAQGTPKRASPRNVVPSQVPASPKPSYAPSMRNDPTASPAHAPAQTQTQGPAQTHPRTNDIHIHHPHHDFPFSHTEAALKQAEAIGMARAEALAQLEALTGRGGAATAPSDFYGGAGVDETRFKGPRGTFETTTSGPSFGHLLHHDGHPIPAHRSYQAPPPPPPDMRGDGEMTARITAGLGGGSFMRIPFGVPIGAAIPRPMVIVRNSTGIGLGIDMGHGPIGGFGALGGIAESPESRRDFRSAYVESVDDEDEVDVKPPTVPSGKSRVPTDLDMAEMPAAKTESGVLHQSFELPLPQLYPGHYPATHTPASAYQPATKQRTYQPSTKPGSVARFPQGSTPPPDFAPLQTGTVSQTVVRETTYEQGPDGHLHPTAAKTTTTRVSARAPPTEPQLELEQEPEPESDTLHEIEVNQTGHDNPGFDNLTEVTATETETRAQSVNSVDTVRRPVSIAQTSATNVQQLVADSSFHDETLCQLLDAARLHLIGDQAKRALMRAARARVIELKDIKEHGEAMDCVLPSVPLARASVTVPTVRKRSKEKNKPSRSKEGQKGDRGDRGNRISMPPGKTSPWDLVTQRLYSWALVWDEQTFVRALENISLGREVEEFPLTVFSMMTFKRNLRYRMTNTPVLPCDKLFVPPNIADGINKAVHAKLFGDAQRILEELWYPFNFETPPRIIISLTRHGAQDAWLANRYDLSTGRLTSYFISHEASRPDLLDSRPFMWWHAIRQAWPQHQIPHPDHLEHTVKTVPTMPDRKEDNSLRAGVISRNLLLGIRPEYEHDVIKLREYIWSEVKRLLVKKRQGRLIVHVDCDDHEYEP